MALNMNPHEEEFLRSHFKTFDTNGNGVIETNELQAILSQLGLPASQYEVQCILACADLDGNGVINFPEFVSAMGQMFLNAAQEKNMLNDFKKYDLDNSGYITAQELKQVLGMPDDEAEEIIRLADVDGDHTINYEEFVKLIN